MIVKAAEIKEIFNLVFYSNENIGLNMAKHTLAGEIIELLKEELNIERSSFQNLTKAALKGCFFYACKDLKAL